MKMHCYNCNKDMKKIKDKFHGFEVNAWKCEKCNEIIYDEKDIQPILQFNKQKENKKPLITTVGILGKSKIFRIPKVAEKLYNVYKGEKLKLDLKPNEMTIKFKEKQN